GNYTREPLPVEAPVRGPPVVIPASRPLLSCHLANTKRESFSLRDYRRARPSASAAIAAGASSRRGNAVRSRDRACTQKEVCSPKVALPSDMSIADLPSARLGRGTYETTSRGGASEQRKHR